MGLALSTAWNSFRYQRASGMLSEIKAVGFKSIELGFSLESGFLAEIESGIGKEKLEITSLHNFCPVPEGLSKEDALPDYYPMSSLDEDIRQKAIKYGKNTIDTAQRLRAKAVVLHSGRVDIPDRTKELATLFKKGLKGTREYNQLKNSALKERQEVFKPYFENTLKSLEVLADYAQEKNLFLGVENRIYIREIPSFEEIGIILNKFKGANVFYWHDTGHAQVLENLGFTPHREYLESYSRQMIGLHLHDCAGTEDHRAPKKGEIDFNLFTPYLSKETLKVIEAHYPSTSQELRESKSYLETLFNGRL